MAQGSHETEIKLTVADPKSARRLLLAAGFRVSRKRVFEANTVFDTPGQSLRQGASLLRVREAGGTATVTCKGPPVPGRYKSREEVELEVADAAAMGAIFARLGFQPIWRYEKYRTEFRQPRRAGVAMLDETPIGVFLELEGTGPWIDRTAGRLGFRETDYITASYASLYLESCGRRGGVAGDMVF